MRSASACWAGVAAIALAGSGAAVADGQASVLDKVEVVGSRISRVDAETALPVQVIGREEIERSGVQTTQELIARVSASVNSWSDALNVGNDAKPGFAGASLRGLGSTATLVLLNGRRLANYAFSAEEVGVDLHAIPLAAVERIEILKDGASAIYGSDAIAGVVNIVMRRDFRGVVASASAGDSERGGGSQTRGTLSGGIGDMADDGYNVFAIVDHLKNGELAARDRAFSSTAYVPQLGLNGTSSSNFPANIPIVGGYANPAAPACNGTSVFRNGGCYYDYPRQSDDLAPLAQTSVLARGTLRLAADHEAFAEALYETHSARYRVSSTPINSIATNGVVEIDVPTSSPYYPQGLGLAGDLHDVRYRTVSLGPRTSDSRSDNRRALVGLRGDLAGWDYDTAIAIAASHATYSLVSGYVDSVAVQRAFDSGLVDPFGPSGPAGDALLAATQVRGPLRSATGITRTIDGHASKTLLELPAGTLSIAIGGEWRHESLDDVEAPIAQTVAGNSYNPPKSGSRDVEAAFAELDVPLLRGLEAQLAVRRDRYSDFGTSWNPKAALRWQPTRGILARASFGRGFRAPSLPELFTARTTTLVEVSNHIGDPVRCPVTRLASDCDPVFPLGYGGNPDLRPVRSTQRSIGLVVQPAEGWSASIDYWRIELRNTINSLDLDTILADDAAYEGKNIVRGPADPAFPGLPGPIIALDTYNENLGRTNTAGFDITTAYRSGPTPLGRFTAQLDGTIVTTWTQQFDGIHDVSSLGVFIGDPVPRWKHQLSLGWERGPYTTTLGQSFRLGYTDAQLLPDGSSRRVASYALWDAQFAYAATSAVTMRIGVRNLFDRDPPFSNQNEAFQAGYDPSYTDPRGRFWYVAASVRFR